MILRIELRIIILIVIFCTALSACEGEDGIIGTGEKSDLVNGLGQKGPFISGSDVSITPLISDNFSTPDTILTNTTDNLGNFNFSAPLNTAYKISIHGIYLNELTGLASSQAMTLNSVYLKNISTRDISSVNVLTHLAFQRIIFLIDSGVSVATAIMTAQQELLTFIVTDITQKNNTPSYNSPFSSWTL